MAKLEIDYPTLKCLVLNAAKGLVDFSMERVNNNSAVVKMKHGSFPLALSVKVEVVSLQSSPEDPIVLKLGIPAFLLSLLKGYIKRDGIEISGNELRVYPQKLTKILNGIRLSKLTFEKDHVVLVLEGEKPS